MKLSRCIATFCFPLACHLAFAQTDPIAVLLKQKNLSNVPLKCQDRMQLGMVIHIRPDGTKNFDCSDASAMAVSLPSITPTVPLVLPQLHVGLDQGAGVALKFLKYVPGLNVHGTNVISADQAVFTSKYLPESSVDALVYTDAATRKTSTEWLKAGQDVYLVTSVYWTKELNITSSQAQSISLSNGKPLATCKSVVSGPADGAASGTGNQQPTAGNAGSDEAQSAKPTKQQDDKNKVTNLAQTATATLTPQIEAGICRDSSGTVHLHSETPVAVGMDVVVLAYWKQPDGSVTFDYDTPRHPPIFP